MYMIPLLYLNILTSFMLLLLRTRVVLSGKKATDILIRKIIKFNVFFFQRQTWGFNFGEFKDSVSE